MKKFSMRILAHIPIPAASRIAPCEPPAGELPFSLRRRAGMLTAALAFGSGLALVNSPNALAQAAATTSGDVVQLRKDAPDSHTVVRGDTLWAISE